MNKIIITLMYSFFIISCNKERDATAIYSDAITNSSTKDIAYYTSCDVGDTTIVLFPSQTGRVQFKKVETIKQTGSWSIDLGDGGVENALVQITDYKITVFNLTDTLGYTLGQNKGIDSLFDSNTMVQIVGTAWDVMTNYTTTIENTFVNSFISNPKDYSMLTRFKEYYSK